MSQEFEGTHEVIAALEQDWLTAETEADEARDRATRAEQAAVELKQIASHDGDEIKLLLGQAERFASRRDRAEAEAAAAFDRFWSAQGGDSKFA